jgi:hypothetical protein
MALSSGEAIALGQKTKRQAENEGLGTLDAPSESDAELKNVIFESLTALAKTPKRTSQFDCCGNVKTLSSTCEKVAPLAIWKLIYMNPND